MPAGQPTKYRPEYCDQVIEMLRQGMCKYEIAAELNVHVHTLDNWSNAHPEFLEAIKNGLVFAQAWWQRHGRLNLGNKDFNSTLWYMNMKNRFGWCDRQEVKQETTHHVGEELDRKVRVALDE